MKTTPAAAPPVSAHHDVGARVRRYDYGSLRPAEKLENGWLRVEGLTARIGILEYEDGGGKMRKELVLPEVLFASDSMASARMVPVTNKHPAALLDDTTARAHQVGSVGESLRPVGDYLGAPLMITDRQTVMDIERGVQQLSWGYDCTLDPPDPSLFIKWGQHDAIQRNRIYNHLAVVDVARAGAGARLRLDSSAASMVASPSSPQPKPERAMKIKIGQHSYDCTPEGAPLIQQALDHEMSDLTARLDAIAKEKAKAEGERATAVKRGDGILARSKTRLKSIKGHLDAFKAKMVPCDECNGTGKVPAKDDDAKTEMCGYCDGKGSFRMHDAIKAMGTDDDAVEADLDADLEEAGEETDDDGLERESAGEEAVEHAANEEHHDAAARKAATQKRRDERKALRAKRRDSLGRMAERRGRARATLLVAAGRHLGAEVKLDGKSEIEVMREVLAKLAPHADAAKLDDAQVRILYHYETKRVDAGAAQAPTASDELRRDMTFPAPLAVIAAAGARADKADVAADKARAAKRDAWKKPGQQPTITEAK